MSKREGRESDSSLKIKSSSYFASDRDESESSESSSFIPYPLILKRVKNRLLSLSPTVRTGLERECNKDDFYRVGDSYIGKGAFGEVWKVSHKMTGKIYVIKVIDKIAIKGQKLIDQINREIEIMYKLNHPHVIKLINHFEDDEKFYLIMPYASNGQLYSLLRRQVRFDQRTAAQYMREVIEAVRYIHSFSPKIIHRDIKPENLLLDDNYRVLLSDFGWSNFLDDDEFRKTFCGTPEYLSPEMVKKEGHNEMVDIWALGVLMFEFLAGYSPFFGSCPKELYNNIKKLKIQWPVDFPPLAKNLITKILKLNPSERLSLDEILDHPWFTQNPPLRNVLTNYLTDEKDILKSHLIIEKPENVEDKLNVLTNPNRKRKFFALKMQLMNENNNNNHGEENNKKNNNSDNEDEMLTSENKESEEINNNNNINNNININNNNMNNNNMNNRLYGNHNIYMGNINENFVILRKQAKILQKKYDELALKESKENKLIKTLKEENEKLKKNQENLKNNHIALIEKEIKKYKLLSENREELLKNIDELNFKNNELNLQNELLKNKVSYFEKQIKYLNDKINEMNQENQKYILEINQIKQNEELLKINIDDKSINNDNDILVNKLNEITEKNIKSLVNNISPLNVELTNFEQKINDSINNNVLSFLNEKMKSFDDLLKEENHMIKINDEDNKSFFEQNKKLIEDLKEEKSKNEIKNNLNKTENVKNKSEILEERIKNLLEEKKVNNELMELKNKELEKANTKIKNMEDKISDIFEFIKTKCKNEAFIKKISTVCNLENIK